MQILSFVHHFFVLFIFIISWYIFLKIYLDNSHVSKFIFVHLNSITCHVYSIDLLHLHKAFLNQRLNIKACSHLFFIITISRHIFILRIYNKCCLIHIIFFCSSHYLFSFFFSISLSLSFFYLLLPVLSILLYPYYIFCSLPSLYHTLPLIYQSISF